MSDSFFSRDSQFVPSSDFYKEWSKIVTEICLPRLRTALSSANSELSGNNTRHVLRSLEWYYEQLNHYAQTERNTVPYLLFPSWPDSLEFPTLFLGDIHPYLITNLIRSFLKRGAYQDSGETSLELAALKIVIESLESEIGLEIPRLLEKMKNAQIRFIGLFADIWVSSNHAQEEQRVMETAANVAMDAEAKKEMEHIFVSANLLRRKVIRRIVEATASDHHLAALFLESLCKIFAGFKDQPQGFKQSPGSSPFVPQLPTTDKDQVHQPPGQSVTPYRIKTVPPNDRTLWMGNIEPDMNEKYILASFGADSEGILSVKITRDRVCAFIQFVSWSAANKALKTYAYQSLPGRSGFYQLNWSTKRVLYNVYVYGLSSSVTADRLKKFFATYYTSVQYVRFELAGSVIRGKVTFADINDWSRSMREMEGFPFDGTPMVITDSAVV